MLQESHAGSEQGSIYSLPQVRGGNARVRGEVEAAKAEGIEIHYLTSPVRIMGKDGKVAKVECVRTKLGEADESGRRRPEPLKGSEFVIEADTVVPAIGEIPDLSFLDAEKFDWAENKTIRIHPRTMMTNIEGIFAGGDVVSGPATVIEAMAAGRKAAFSIDNTCAERARR